MGVSNSTSVYWNLSVCQAVRVDLSNVLSQPTNKPLQSYYSLPNIKNEGQERGQDHRVRKLVLTLIWENPLALLLYYTFPKIRLSYKCHSEINRKLGVVVHTFNSALRRQKQAGKSLWFQASRVYTVKIKDNQGYTVRPWLNPPPPLRHPNKQNSNQLPVVAHTSNPRTKEMELYQQASN